MLAAIFMNKKQQSEQAKKMNWLSTLSLAWELGYTIAIPIVVLGFGGAYADKKLGTTPLFILIGIAFAMILTGFGIYRKVKKINNY